MNYPADFWSQVLNGYQKVFSWWSGRIVNDPLLQLIDSRIFRSRPLPHTAGMATDIVLAKKWLWKDHFLTSGSWVEPGSQSDSDAKYCKNCEIFPRFVCWVGSWVNENWPKAESVVTKTKVDSVDKNFGFAFLMFNFYSRVLICHLHVYMYTCIHWLKLER